jgi:transcriptional regulator of acetoin/glycerol metabolism
MATVVSQVLTKISEGRTTRVGPAAMRVISRYSWPRNITQLEEALTAALLRRPVGDIQPEDLPGYCHDSARRQLTGMEALERDAIVNALRDARGRTGRFADLRGRDRAGVGSPCTNWRLGRVLNAGPDQTRGAGTSPGSGPACGASCGWAGRW